MADTVPGDIYISFFMVTADLRPENVDYTQIIANHMRSFLEMGYDGFDLPIAPTAASSHAAEVASYMRMREHLEKAGLCNLKIATNVGATRRFDPTSPYKEQRDGALAYLKSRVDITKALGGTLLAGPIIFPYGVFPVNDTNAPIWSDALQESLPAGYERARPVLIELCDYAELHGIKVAIEPVDHWETAAPNLVSDVLGFLEDVPNPQLGICIDSAHVALGSDGPAAFRVGVSRALDAKRLHYIHISAPDRGAIHNSWIPWKDFLDPVVPRFQGPFLIEVFNAIPAFLNGLRLTRRKFWLPNEDPPESRASAYDISAEALATIREKLKRFKS